MTIARLKKVSICGLVNEKLYVLDGLQALGCLHLISLQESLPEPEKAVSERPENTYKALKYLLACPNKRHQIKDDARFEIEKIVRKTNVNQQRLRDLTDQRDFLIERIKAVKPWGDFKLLEQGELAGYRLWFYIVPLNKLKQLPDQDYVWEIVSQDHQLAHVVVVSKEEPAANEMPVKRTHTGTLSLTELKNRLDQTELELEDCCAQRESLTRWITLMTQNLASSENKSSLKYAAEQTLDTAEIFAVQGWVAEKDSSALIKFAEQKELAMLWENPGAGDKPPTKMLNPDKLQAGEDLVKFYKTPGYREWDPSVPVFFSFSLFFAIIISDAGYGLLMAVLLAFYWQALAKTVTTKRIRILLATLISFTCGWGILIGGYFGVEPEPSSWLGKLKILDIHDFDAMMKLSVLIGILHISYANIQKSFCLRIDQSGLLWLQPLGWILLMFGGFIFWLDQMNEQTLRWQALSARYLMLLGLMMVFLFSSQRKISNSKTFFFRLLDGFHGLSGISKIFGDLLSYLRLFALGLAGASLSFTFNDLAMQAREIEGLGLLYSLLILLLGHLLNFLLSLMSAVVHGLRLNVIEFLNWGLSDEGYPFKAFVKKGLRK